MNVLVLGSGGREHALSHKIVQSTKCEQLFIAPGNGGTAALGENVSLDIESAAEVAAFVKSHLEAGFPLRCFQRLSFPNIATGQCHWRDNPNTRGSSTPVLSY